MTCCNVRLQPSGPVRPFQTKMIKVFVGLIALWRLVRGVELDEIKAVLSKAIDKRTSAHCGKYSTELEDSWVKTYSEFHRKELNQNYDNAKFLIFVPNLSGKLKY